jgi:hypothetical protein
MTIKRQSRLDNDEYEKCRNCRSWEEETGGYCPAKGVVMASADVCHEFEED